jgi:hypothetical protein
MARKSTRLKVPSEPKDSPPCPFQRVIAAIRAEEPDDPELKKTRQQVESNAAGAVLVSLIIRNERGERLLPNPESLPPMF